MTSLTDAVPTGHNSGLLEVWDLPSKTLRFSVHSHSATITDIAYSTINGQLMVTSGLLLIYIIIILFGNFYATQNNGYLKLCLCVTYYCVHIIIHGDD